LRQSLLTLFFLKSARLSISRQCFILLHLLVNVSDVLIHEVSHAPSGQCTIPIPISIPWIKLSVYAPDGWSLEFVPWLVSRSVSFFDCRISDNVTVHWSLMTRLNDQVKLVTRGTGPAAKREVCRGSGCGEGIHTYKRFVCGLLSFHVRV
jgi:hypothetical protein